MKTRMLLLLLPLAFLGCVSKKYVDNKFATVSELQDTADKLGTDNQRTENALENETAERQNKDDEHDAYLAMLAARIAELDAEIEDLKAGSGGDGRSLVDLTNDLYYTDLAFKAHQKTLCSLGYRCGDPCCNTYGASQVQKAGGNSQIFNVSPGTGVVEVRPGAQAPAPTTTNSDDKRYDALEKRIQGVEGKFEPLEGSLDEIEKELGIDPVLDPQPVEQEKDPDQELEVFKGAAVWHRRFVFLHS